MSTHEMQFIFQQNIRKVLDHFSRLLAVRFCFLAADGRELQVGENKSHCRFCRLMRTKMGLAQQCDECDRQGWSRAARSGKAVWYRCHAGLIDGCTAVRSHGRTFGYMMIGQFRTTDTCKPALLTEWRRRYDNNDLQDAFLKTPRYTRRQVEDIMGVFSVLANFIVSQRMIAPRGAEAVAPLLSYMAEHPRQTLSTAEAGKLLHRSPSSLSHVFKQATGKSFLQHQIAMKLDLADELFRTRRATTVREVAFELGFKDPYYFSRLYRKHKGHPPSQTILAARRTSASIS